MDPCVLSSSSFHASVSLDKLGRRFRGKNSVLPRKLCCLAEESSSSSSSSSSGGTIDDDKFLHLSPKPKPIPLPLSDDRSLRQQELDDEESRRMMTFLQNFPDKSDQQSPTSASDSSQTLPDPASDNFREEMRKRLLYTEPPPPFSDDDEDEDNRQRDIEFDMFEHLVLTIRHILHLRYSIGERLETEDELILLEEAIPYHPEREFKVGVGIEYIKVDVHPEFGSRCFFIVRKDKSEIDFSYRKCMMGLAEAKPAISLDRARDLIYFFKSNRGQDRPRYYSIV